MLVVNIFIECIQDKTQEVYELYSTYSNGKIDFDGNLSIRVYKNENEVVLIEEWTDESYLNRFLETDEYKNISKNLDGKIKSVKVKKYSN